MTLNQIRIFNSVPDYSSMRVVLHPRLQSIYPNRDPKLLGFHRSRGTFIGLVIELDQPQIEIPWGYYELALASLWSSQSIQLADTSNKLIEFWILLVSEKEKTLWIVHPRLLLYGALKASRFDEWQPLFYRLFGILLSAGYPLALNAGDQKDLDTITNFTISMTHDQLRSIFSLISVSDLGCIRTTLPLSSIEQFTTKFEDWDEIDLTEYSLPSSVLQQQKHLQQKFNSEYEEYHREFIRTLQTSPFFALWEIYEQNYTESVENFRTDYGVLESLIQKKIGISPTTHKLHIIEAQSTMLVIKCVKINASPTESPQYLLIFFSDSTGVAQWCGPIALGLFSFQLPWTIRCFTVETSSISLTEIPTSDLFIQIRSSVGSNLDRLQEELMLTLKFHQQYSMTIRPYGNNFAVTAENFVY